MISVIVPVYNCENYLEKSIESLLKQTFFEQLEIILVDDGSTDTSAIIMKKYTEKYKNIKMVNQCNVGVSAARNHGIEEATGEYIAFFDGDDMAENTLYEHLYQLMISNHADLSCVNYSMSFSDGTTKVHKKLCQKNICGSEMIESFLKDDLIGINIFDKLFKASIVKQIEFPEGYAIGEDMYFVFQYLRLSNIVAIDTTKSLYGYCIRTNSAMKSKFSTKYFDSIDLAALMMQELPKNLPLYSCAEANYMHEICKVLALYYQNQDADYIKKIEEYKKLLKSYSILKAYKYMSRKHFVSLVLMRISPKCYIFLYKLMRIG